MLCMASYSPQSKRSKRKGLNEFKGREKILILLILYRNTIPESLIGTITEGEFNEVLVSGKIKGRHCEPTKRHSHDSSN